MSWFIEKLEKVSFGGLRWHDATAARFGRCAKREEDRGGDLGPEDPGGNSAGVDVTSCPAVRA